jgi:hypothetical protein
MREPQELIKRVVLEFAADEELRNLVPTDLLIEVMMDFGVDIPNLAKSLRETLDSLAGRS